MEYWRPPSLEERLAGALHGLIDYVRTATAEDDYSPIVAAVNSKVPGLIEFLYPIDYADEEKALDTINRLLIESKAEGAVIAYPSIVSGNILFTVLAPGLATTYSAELKEDWWNKLVPEPRNSFPMITAFRGD